MNETLPFMDAREIQAILTLLEGFNRPVNILEWGSGNSTIYFSRRIPSGSHWLSIEHNSEWAEHVQSQLVQLAIPGVELKLVKPNSIFRDGIDDGDLISFHNYVLFPSRLNQKFDIILVDGRARVECMKVGWPLLTNTGVMILHDAERPEYIPGMPRNGSQIRLDIMNDRQQPVRASIFFGSSDRLKIFGNQMSHIIEAAAPRSCDLDAGLGKNQPIAPVKGALKTTKVNKPLIKPRHEQTKNRCIFLNTYYPGFLNNVYNRNPGLSSAPYQVQKDALQAEFFGDSDFYSRGLIAAGWQADDLIINCEPLQAAWARENNFNGEGLEIAIEQIRRENPQVVYMQDLNLATQEFQSAIRPYSELIAGQIASPLPPQANLSGFDLLFSSFPHFTKRFRQAGITAYTMPLAFDPRILTRLPLSDRRYPVTFVGGISGAHNKGTIFLETLAGMVDIDFWGYGVGTLPPDSRIRKRHHGEAWGLDMFALLNQSFITINRHTDTAENNANNMRLFEATGCGALLITDYRDNLNELFEIGKEVVAYRSAEECAALIRYYLAHPAEAREIAEAGQRRTLTQHIYGMRMEKTGEILDRHIKYHRQDRAFTSAVPAVSYGYKKIAPSQVTDTLINSWKSQEIPAKQRALVQKELFNLYHNYINPPFQVLSESLRRILADDMTILEIGCASGYYSEILEYLLDKPIHYTGVDYSFPLIEMAHSHYSKTCFQVADGAHLPFDASSFTVVISSCIILHVPNYKEHIAETARVVDRYLIAHRTPICRDRPTQYYKKFAYDVETVELCFNEQEILTLFTGNGLKLLEAKEISADPEHDSYFVTYIFEKIKLPVDLKIEDIIDSKVAIG